ncbi:MAG: hypothetical protein QXS32_08335 [Candidatus Nezhaarchaeales archaeon]
MWVHVVVSKEERETLFHFHVDEVGKECCQLITLKLEVEKGYRSTYINEFERRVEKLKSF